MSLARDVKTIAGVAFDALLVGALIGAVFYISANFTNGDGSGISEQIQNWLYSTFGIGSPTPLYTVSKAANDAVGTLSDVINTQQNILSNELTALDLYNLGPVTFEDQAVPTTE